MTYLFDRIEKMEKHIQELDIHIENMAKFVNMHKEEKKKNNPHKTENKQQDIYLNKNKMPKLDNFLAYIIIDTKKIGGENRTFLLTANAEIKLESFVPTPHASNVSKFIIDGCVDVSTLHSEPEVYKLVFYQVASGKTILDVNESFKNVNNLISEMMECGNELSRESLYWQEENQFYQLKFKYSKSVGMIAMLSLIQYNETGIKEMEEISCYTCSSLNLSIEKSDRAIPTNKNNKE